MLYVDGHVSTLNGRLKDVEDAVESIQASLSQRWEEDDIIRKTLVVIFQHPCVGVLALRQRLARPFLCLWRFGWLCRNHHVRRR